MIIDIAKAFSEKESFLITTHMSPDGDAIGSVSAIAYLLENLNKDVTVFIHDGIPYDLTFLNGKMNVVTDLPLRHYDVALALDCADMARIGEEFEKFKNYDILVNIDHHKDNTYFGDLNLVEKNACSTGFLVYKVIKALGVEVTHDIAQAVYTTILVDTGSFRYSNATPEAFNVASELMEKGVNAWDVAEKVYENQPVERVNLLKLALNSVEIYDDKGFAAITVTKKMLKDADTDFTVTDGFINIPRSVKGIEVALFFKEIYPNRYKLSLRSKGKADVGMIAAKFGGGGHKNAAGCILNGKLPELKEKVFACVDEYLKGLD